MDLLTAEVPIDRLDMMSRRGAFVRLRGAPSGMSGVYLDLPPASEPDKRRAFKVRAGLSAAREGPLCKGAWPSHRASVLLLRR